MQQNKIKKAHINVYEDSDQYFKQMIRIILTVVFIIIIMSTDMILSMFLV